MADNLIFPIGFDLEKGVKDVISRSDTYLRQIEHAMNRKPIVLRAEVDASKFQMFSRQFTNSIDGISAKLAQAQRLWNAMTFDVKFDADGNLSRRAQVVFDAFQQLTQASATMGQRLGEVNRNLAKSEQDTARAITAEYDKRRQQVNEQIRLKERQAAAEERVRQGQLKGVNAGYVETQRQVEAVRNLRLQYEAILPMLNAMAQRRYDIKVGIDKQFEADIQRINAEIARLRQSNLQLGAKGDTNAIQANLQAIRQLEAELQRISQQKIDLLNSNKINSDLARLRTEISSVFGELQSAERRLATDNSLNAALDAQSQKVLKLHADIQKLDQQFAQLNATGRAYNQDGSFTAQANTLLQQRIALTKQLEQEAITGQQAQIKLEQQLREEKRQTEQAAKNAAKEAERQAKAEAAARKQAQDAANAENQARQEAYNARRRQGLETQRILNKEAKSIADITAKLQIQQQRLQSANIGSAKFNKIAEEVKRLTADLEKANQKMRELTGQTQSGAARQSAAVKRVSDEYRNQETYVSRLIKRMAVYASFAAVGNFLTNIREVTAQFELQRVSLGAILQDQNKANQLFSEIKAFALKSPVSILDLTKYTKQLAAYKIGYDELFDTTKRLTDVSVGLGVSMDRVVLAYGQVRATGHLRASEVRQFTEMGVPIVEELAAKLSKMNGEMVTSEQVMDMISKRAISFEMVKEVFDDMTSAGGMFYNMQEKQGNTLYGLWAKLGDAASVMYSEIGNTGLVNDGMKSLISGMTSLMKNWRLVAGEAMVAVASFGAYKAIQALTVVSTEASTKATQRLMAAKNGLTAAQNRLTAAQRLGNQATIRHANLAVLEAQWTVKAATASRLAANATNVWTAAKYRLIAATSQLKAAVAGNWIMLTVAALAAIVVAIAGAIEKATRLKRALDDIEASTINLQNQSVGRFEYLAEAAVNAADGSKIQRDALAELSRAYGDILPQDALKLENLKKLNHQYGALTTTIKEYIAVQQKNKGMEEISNEYGGKINEASKQAIDSLVEFTGVERDVAINIVGEMQRDIQEKLEKGETDLRTTAQKLQAAAKRYGVSISDSLANFMTSQEWNDNWYDYIGLGEATNEFQAFAEAVSGQYNELDEWNKRVAAATNTLAGFADMQKRVSDVVANATYKTAGGEPIDPDKQGDLLDAMKLNLWVKQTAAEIQNNEEIKEAFAYMGEGIKSEWFNIINAINSNDLGKVSQINFDAIIASVDSMIAKLGNKNPEILAILNTFRNYLVAQKNEYENMVPSKAVVVRWQTTWRQIVKELKISGQNMNRYLMGSAEDFETYRKRIKDEVASVIKTIALLQDAITKNKKTGKRTKEQQAADEKELQQAKERKAALVKLLAELDKIDIETGKKNKGLKGSKGSKGSKSDTRLQVLQEVAQTLATINKEYDDLAKKEGASKALADIKERFKDVLSYANKLGGKFGLNFGLPTEFKTLQEYRNAILKVMQSLKGLPKGSEKTILDFKTMIGKADSDYLQKQIEAELKRLADRISRTKTAKEFYEKILGMTGDIQLSANLTVSVYGQNGQDLQDAIREQIRMAFETDPEKNTTIDLSEAIDPDTGAINYNKLAELEEKYKDVLIDGRADLRKKLIDEGRKTSKAQVQQWLKDIEKAKDFAQQRIDLATYTANQIAAINAREDLPQADKKKLIKGYQDREAKQLAKLQYEEFKDSAMYVHIFEDLDHASTTALKNMRDRLIALKGQWKNLDPMQVKELTKAIADLDEQIAGRSPFKSILDGFKGLADARPQKVIDAEMIAATDELAKREEALAAATRKLTEAQTAQVNAQAEVAQARQNLEDALAVSGGEETAKVKAAREVLGIKIATFNAVKAASKDSIAAAKTEVDKAADKYEEQKIVIDKLVEEGNLREANIKKIELANQKIDEYQQQINEALDGIRKMMEAFGASDEDMQFFDDVVGSLNEIVDAGQQATMSVASFMSGNILGGITSGVSAIGGLVSGFTNLFSAGKVRKANKEIKRQQKLLEQLQYTYGRLESASDKLFGRDYLNNYNQQLKNLQAQQAAYEKQAAAERSKGKKKDKKKIKEHENQARETADKIKELQEDLVAQFTGSSRTDVARQMAKSWIDARASMSDTFAAIKGDYQDLIKNMIVEGAAARVIENALTPVWDSMQKMLDKNDVQGAIDSLVNGMDSALNAANSGMEVLWKALEARGYDMKQLIGDTDSEYSGIAKSVAGATSEEINNVAAIGNTLMYYASPIPRIDENLARVVAIMEGRGASAIPQTTSAGWTDWQQQAMDNYIAIQRNTADTVVECRRAAEACERIASTFKVKGSTKGLNVFLNS